MRPIRRGLVLGAGGVLGGAWTIGALKALEVTREFDPRTAEVLIGTSAGSVLASFLGNDVSVDSMVNHQRGILAPGDPEIDFDPDEVAPLPPMPRLRLGSSRLLLRTARHPRHVTPLGAMSSVLPLGRGSLDSVRRLVNSVCPPGTWAIHRRAWVVAMDYDTGRRVVFGRPGSPECGLAEAVMASCAIPGWYAPVHIHGRRYVDGGACSVTSLDLVIPLGLDEVYVLSPMTSWEFDTPSTRPAKLERYFRRQLTRRLDRETAKVRATGTKVILLGPGADDLREIGANLMDARRRDAVLETSLRTSAASLSREQPGFAATG